MDLLITLERRSPAAAGRPAGLVEASGQVLDLLLQARRDQGEVLLVACDERGSGLGDEPCGQVEGCGG